ncbi:MAG: M48 family metallopeptidase [Phycisphaerales bacterium]
MFHLWVIALFMCIVWRDSVAAPLVGEWLGLRDTIIATLVPMLLIGAGTVWRVRRLTRHVEATGSYRSIRAADRTLAISRWLAVLVHAIGVLGLGWLDAVRMSVGRVTGTDGDVILIDELIALAPAVLVFIAGWWSMYPLDRLLRESAIYRTLHAGPAARDEADPAEREAAGDGAGYSAANHEAEPAASESGGVLYPVPSRWEYVHGNIRHQLLLALVPLLLLVAWRETVQFGMDHIGAAASASAERALGAGRHPGPVLRALNDPHKRAFASDVLQLAGILGVFILSPLIMRFVWDTTRLEPGPTRDRLLRLCRSQGVRVSDILVWRTHGTLMNGAVMGLIPHVRYVLLTDVMLDVMPTRELEAVMAHEIAHVKHRHMLWLGLGIIVAVTVAAAAASVLLAVSGLDPNLLQDNGAVEIAATIGTLAVAVSMFGLISRRFEWQADAFAAKCLSQLGPGEGRDSADRAAPAAPAVVTPLGARAMIDALDVVARINHIPRGLRSWRHGSIALRQDKLAAIIGRPLARVPADRDVRLIKISIVAAVVLLVSLSVVDIVMGAAG